MRDLAQGAGATQISLCGPFFCGRSLVVYATRDDSTGMTDEITHCRLSNPKLISSLSAGHDANKFDAIAFGQRFIRPFAAMQSQAIVLDENRLRRELITFDQLRDGLRAARIALLAVERNRHTPRT